MTIYLDNDYKCHVSHAEGLVAAETDFFDGKCKRCIEGYRFVPDGQTWTRADGEVFYGEMISPAEDSRILEAVQRQYEEMAAEMAALEADNADKTAALEVLGVTE